MFTRAWRAEMNAISDSWKAASASVNDEMGTDWLWLRRRARVVRFNSRFDDRVEKLRLGLADLRGIDQGEDFDPAQPRH